tara:strand:- start:166 stop:627 length:462 start_codon:yes stop_codon:yes gene_type:complete
MFEYLVFNNVQTLVTLLTSDLISTAINDTSNVILSIIKDDYKDYPDLIKVVKELDLIYKFKIIKSFLLLIPKKYEKINCIKLGLNGIKDIIINIYKLLIEIINIINIHKMKYLSYIRKVKYKNELLELKNLSDILDNRYNMLIKIIKIIKIKI